MLMLSVKLGTGGTPPLPGSMALQKALQPPLRRSPTNRTSPTQGLCSP